MKVPLRWLREFVATDLSAAAIADRLTMAGLEAEKIETIGGEWDKVYVGQVDRVERHPNADRLSLVEVSAGEHHLTVVTGAPNIAAGQKVALALAGARLIDGHSDSGERKTLKPGVIRGVRSEGMVCSEKELGLSAEHEGILVLSPGAPVGVPLAEYLGDQVIEFEITPNLVHAFSVRGIAKELAALTGAPYREPPRFDLAGAPAGPGNLVEIADPDLCARYLGAVIEGVGVGPSPDWLARRLVAAGLRPINNVVDVTNYVMLEWGQPLHAFDQTRLAGGRIVVRRAAPGETIETLDHERRQLSPETLVIADAERPVGIAGVMGGLDSEVHEGTTTVLLEAANFDQRSVRRTAREQRLRTDASARFERGLDPNLVGPAAARAIHLLLALCPGARVMALRDVYPRPRTPRTLSLPLGQIERVLGVRYEPEVVLEALDRLGFRPTLVQEDAGLVVTVVVPTERSDVTIPEDIVEEVARFVGYDSLPETLPDGPLPPVRRDPLDLLERAVRDLLVGAGAAECVTYVTVGARQLAALDGGGEQTGFLHRVAPERLLRLRNPLQADRDLLRPTLLPALLEVAAENLKHRAGVRLFELARVYLGRAGAELPDEPHVLGIVLAGQRDRFDRFARPGELDYFDLKGILEALLAGLKLTAAVAPAAHPALHPGRAAALTIGGERLALLGELRPDVAAEFGLEGVRVAVAELDVHLLLEHTTDRRLQIRVPHYLPVTQDFAVVVAEETPAAAVEAALLAGAGPLATGLTLFDIFRGSQIGPGKKSLAYRVTFTAPDRALTDADLGKVRGKIERTLAQRVGGALRA